MLWRAPVEVNPKVLMGISVFGIDQDNRTEAFLAEWGINEKYRCLMKLEVLIVEW
jgi:hypothetical protein